MKEQEIFKKRYNELLFETAKFVISFFDNHNIKYFAGFGTAIGAVRHNGIIPWDDDFDIIIYRDDVDKLLALNEELEKNGYKFVTFYDEKYYFPQSKIIKLNTSLWEIESHPFCAGIFVDVFYLYRTSLSLTDIKKNMDKMYRYSVDYFTSIEEYTFSSCVKTIYNLTLQMLKGNPRNLFAFFYHRLLSPFKTIFRKRLINFESLLNSKEGDKLVAYTESRYRYKEIYDASWFNGYVEFPYEDFKVKLPIFYHEILTHIYGDYMTPPTNVSDTTEHEDLRYYINLKERLTIEDIRKRIKKGERRVF